MYPSVCTLECIVLFLFWWSSFRYSYSLDFRLLLLVFLLLRCIRSLVFFFVFWSYFCWIVLQLLLFWNLCVFCGATMMLLLFKFLLVLCLHFHHLIAKCIVFHCTALNFILYIQIRTYVHTFVVIARKIYLKSILFGKQYFVVSVVLVTIHTGDFVSSFCCFYSFFNGLFNGGHIERIWNIYIY